MLPDGYEGPWPYVDDEGITYNEDGTHTFPDSAGGGTYYEDGSQVVEVVAQPTGDESAGKVEDGLGEEAGSQPEASDGDLGGPEQATVTESEASASAESPTVSENSAETVERQAVYHEQQDGSVVIEMYDKYDEYNGVLEIRQDQLQELAQYLGVVPEGDKYAMHVYSGDYAIVNAFAVIIAVAVFAVFGTLAVQSLIRSME